MKESKSPDQPLTGRHQSDRLLRLKLYVVELPDHRLPQLDDVMYRAELAASSAPLATLHDALKVIRYFEGFGAQKCTSQRSDAHTAGK